MRTKLLKMFINLLLFLSVSSQASWSWCFSLHIKGVIWWLMVCCSLPVQWKCLENYGSFWPTVSSQQDWREPRPNPPISYPTVRNQDWCILSDLWHTSSSVGAGLPEALQEGAAAPGSQQKHTPKCWAMQNTPSQTTLGLKHTPVF